MLQLVDLLLQHRDLSYLLVDDQVAHVEHLSSVFAGADSHERRIGDVAIFQQGLGFGSPPPPRLYLITRYAMKLRIFNGFRKPVVGGKTCKVGSEPERKHHFDCSIFQKNIRFIAKGFIVFCPIFLSNDAEKEIMRQQDQNTGRLRTSQQSPEKQNRHPREASAGERRYGHSTRPFNRKSSATTGQPQ